MMKRLPLQVKMDPWVAALILLCTLALAACSSSNDDSPPLDDEVLHGAAAELLLTFHSVKTFRFTWSDVADADYYRLLENPDGVSGFTQVGSDVLPGAERIDHIVPLYARANAQYILQSCTDNGCVDANVLTVTGTLDNAIGYIKAGNTDLNDSFGRAVSLSSDGNTLAVSAADEDSAATGINGDQTDNSANDAGAVYVFVRSNGLWQQQAYLKASNTDTWDRFGGAVSLSADGNTLAVGVYAESSGATGINGDQTDNSVNAAGAVYVFVRSNGLWQQQAYLKPSNTDSGDYFGWAVSLSANGNTLAVSAANEDSAATGINGDQADNSGYRAGAVYVFVRSNGLWQQQAYLKASNTDTWDGFGGAVSLSADGNTLAVSAADEDSASTGINGDQTDNSASGAGAVYVFVRSNGLWQQQAYLKASNTDSWDTFGVAVSLSADGNTLAVGANEGSAATGINGDQTDNSANDAGAVYVFVRSNGLWQQQAYLKASNTDSSDYFGWAVSLSANGNTLAVSAANEDSAATGINGDQTDNSANDAGAVYVFVRSNGLWQQQAYLKSSNTDAEYFGGDSDAVSLSADGNTLAVGVLVAKSVYLY